MLLSCAWIFLAFVVPPPAGCRSSFSANQFMRRPLSNNSSEMNMASSRSHCIYIFRVQQELAMESMDIRDAQEGSIRFDDKFEVRLGILSEIFVQEDTHQSMITGFLRLPRDCMNREMFLHKSRMRALDIYCQTRCFSK